MRRTTKVFLLAALVLANAMTARVVVADGWYDDCEYGKNPVDHEDRCVEYCATNLGSCGSSCEEADGCQYPT